MPTPNWDAFPDPAVDRRNSLLAEMVRFDFAQTTWNNAEP